MNLLISIKPEFVRKIISGEKKYEFRRSIFRKEVDKIYIYSTSPEKKVIGYFKSNKIINDTPQNLWKNYSNVSGTSKESFFEYFKGKDMGFAIKIDDLHVFDQSIDTKKLKDFKAPQSFCYINKDLTINNKRMKWTHHFSKPVLKKGYDYYKSDRVKIKKSSNKIIEANVRGSHEYDLRINFENDCIKSMYCNCPFEGNCKHLAGVLYYADNHPEIFKSDPDIYTVMDGMSSDELREFLIPELINDYELSNKFRLFTNQDIDEEYYIEKLKNSWDNSTQVFKFIDDDMQSLINAGRFDLIFKLCDVLILILDEYNYEHMWYAYENLCEKLEKLMCQLINSECRNQAKEFMAKVILDSEDEALSDGFSFIYSKYWDVDAIFDE